MELSFITKPIRDICERKKQATDVFRPECVQLLHDALAELRAAPTVGDVADWNGRMVPRNKSDRLVFHFAQSVKIEFKANHVRNPMEANGNLAWENVSSIKILKVEIKNAEDN